MGKGGRPTKLTPEAEAKALSAARVAAPMRAIAKFTGVSLSNLNVWLVKGRANPRSREGRFYEHFMQAIATAEVGALAQVFAAGRRDWRAAARYLAMRWPDRYGRKSTIALEGAPASPGAGGKPRPFELTLKVIRAAGVEPKVEREDGD